MSSEYRLKQHIDEIIDNAFYDDEIPNKERYKWFKLKFIDEKRKSMSGCYICKTHEIKVFDFGVSEENNISTLLHEVAHHIDWCNRKKSDHQAEFYAIFRKLLYSALDLKKITPEDMINNMKARNTDYNKVQKMIKEYVKKEAKVKTDELLHIEILNAFYFKEKLYGNGYHWDNIKKVWYKDIKQDEKENEYDFLYEIGIESENIRIISSNNMGMKKV